MRGNAKDAPFPDLPLTAVTGTPRIPPRCWAHLLFYYAERLVDTFQGAHEMMRFMAEVAPAFAKDR